LAICSNAATCRRSIPKMAKNSFQKVCFSADSLVVPAHLEANSNARLRISALEISTLADLAISSP
jgi:hypothetical protein